jgi:predicted metal-dependent phosphoesterase TrpH
VLVVPGIEVLCDYGDFLVFGAPEGCVGLRQDINALIGFVHGAGGIIIAAHPYCGYGVCRALGEDAALPILTQLDAIEAENGMTPAIANTRARAVADRLGKPVTGGSDAHAYHDMLKAATEFTAEISTAADVVTAIKAGRCRAVRLDGSFVS